MRIIVMGQQAFGKDCLAKILDAGVDEVVAVYCEPDRGDKVDPIKELALERGLPIEQPADFDSDAAIEQLSAYNADLMVMAFVNVFVNEMARETPRMGSICFHPSLLPLHRGPSAVNWPIIFGAERSGFSWFYPTDGLDEGDILLQWDCAIEPDDTVIDLYFKKIYPAGVDSVLQVCDLFRDGDPPRSAQDESQATYEYRCRKKHAEIDWAKPVAEVYNLIRGTNPAPGAWTTLDGAELGVFDCAKVAGAGAPGEVLSVGEDGVSIAAQGGAILMKRVRPAGEGKIPASDWAKSAQIVAGKVLAR